MNFAIIKSQFLKSFYILKNNPKYLIFSIIFDALFFITYSFFLDENYGVIPVSNMITDKANVMLQIASNSKDSINQLIAQGKNLFQALNMQPGFNSSFKAILLWFLVLMVSTYLIYCIFQSLNWRISRKLTGSKFRTGEFMKSFFKINILWFALLYLGMFFERIIGILILLGGKKQDTGVIALIITIIIAYFAFISYALIGKKGAVKQSFILGFKKFLIFVPMYAIIAIVFLIIHYILLFAQQMNYVLMVVLGVLLFLPALTWARIFICLAVNKVKNA